MNAILFGFKGSGKTYFGKRLSAFLKRPFLDMDDSIVELCEKETGQKLSIRKIHETLGEVAFRSLEKKAISQLDKNGNAIIALGGGAVLDPSNVAFLQKAGVLIYLKMRFETAKKRIVQSGAPSFADAKNPVESLRKIYRERIPIYEAIKAPCIDTDTLNETEVIEQLCKIIQSREGSHGF